MIRVTRILTYVYRDERVFLDDQAHWQAGISGVYRPNGRVTIRSATLPAEVVEGPEEPPAWGKPDQERLMQLLAEQGAADPRGTAAAINQLFGYAK